MRANFARFIHSLGQVDERNINAGPGGGGVDPGVPHIYFLRLRLIPQSIKLFAM